jgi:hypothetical protein
LVSSVQLLTRDHGRSSAIFFQEFSRALFAHPSFISPSQLHSQTTLLRGHQLLYAWVQYASILDRSTCSSTKHSVLRLIDGSLKITQQQKYSLLTRLPDKCHTSPDVLPCLCATSTRQEVTFSSSSGFFTSTCLEKKRRLQVDHNPKHDSRRYHLDSFKSYLRDSTSTETT